MRIHAMKITLALLFLGLIAVVAVANPGVDNNSQQHVDDQDDVLNDGKDIQEDENISDEEADNSNDKTKGSGIDVQRRSMRTYILCESHSGILSCPHGQRIQVHFANYGRTTGGHVCPHRSIRTHNCYSYYSSRVIRCACHNHQNCRLFAHHLNFGDPCVGTYKYIEVKYTCS